MLKKIPVDDLRLGMHLHAMCGAGWLDHPFWRTKFILDDPADLDKLRASSVKEVWIDVSGRDVEAKRERGRGAAARPRTPPGRGRGSRQAEGQRASRRRPPNSAPSCSARRRW